MVQDEDIMILSIIFTVILLIMILFAVMKVLIFAEKKQDVDAIHEYLLLKSIEAVSIHGGKGEK